MSVVVLCFNTGGYVVEALESLRAQTFGDYEVVVVDDASTDDTVDRIRRWSDDTAMRLTLLVNKHNLGIPGALNRGIAASSGRLVTWLSDDVWGADRLLTVVECFDAVPPTVGILFGDAVIVDAANRQIASLVPATTLGLVGVPAAVLTVDRAPGSTTILSGASVRRALFWRSFLPTPTVTIRRSLYDRIGPYDETLSVEDLDCWFRAAAVTDFAYVQVPLVRYRRHETNHSTGRSRSYLLDIERTLRRHASGEAAEEEKAIRRHLREEALRVAHGMFDQGVPMEALHPIRQHYLPNLETSIRCAKETARLLARGSAALLRGRSNRRAARRPS